MLPRDIWDLNFCFEKGKSQTTHFQCFRLKRRGPMNFVNFFQKIPKFVNPILHGAGHFVPRLVDYLVWLFGESPNLSHFSWLCFFQHLLCPIEAIFQKKKFEILKNRKNISRPFRHQRVPPLKKKFWKLFFSNFL